MANKKTVSKKKPAAKTMTRKAMKSTKGGIIIVSGKTFQKI